MKKKIIWGIIVVILAVIGWFVWAFNQGTTPTWKTYTSEKYGYSIGYPPTWEISGGDNGLGINSPDGQSVNLGIYTYPRASGDPVTWKKESAIINGKSVEKITFEDEEGSHSRVRIINNNSQYLLTFPRNELETMIFRSFKFTN